MNIHKAIEILDSHITNPSYGLPEEVFFFISRVTPMINVDLLIKDEKGRTLLAWRNDRFAGEGWHVPGGIVRYRETLEKRIIKVSETEIGASVDFDPVPLAINQIIDKNLTTRGHFISILYKCNISCNYIPQNTGLSNKDQGYLMWHDRCPENLIKVHEIYRNYI
ncbi:MAG: NUDIX domain-containing protein [Candidatus Eremiobacterota bacterium]